MINDSNPSVQSALRFANPKLNLNKITVFRDVIVFDEITDDKIYNSSKAILVPTFPYSDDETLDILTKNNVKKIYIHPVDALEDTRLKAVIGILNKAGIKTVVDK